MSQILVRNLDPDTVDRLKQLAKAHKRSLQAEAKLILEEAARRHVSPARREELLRRLQEIRERSGPQTTDSADLIREDRDR